MKRIFLFWLFFSLINISFSQHPNVLIHYESAYNAPEEPSIIIDPLNTNNLVAGANLNNYYYSTDGGINWQTNTLSSTYGVWGDPCIIVDTAGHFYFFHLSYPQSGSWIDRIVCQKTEDMGQTWSNGSFTGLNGTKNQDKEWAIVDRTNNNIYVSWTQFDDYGSYNPNDKSNIHFSKSIDGGVTWTDALRINKVSGDCVDEDNTVEGAVPAVGPNGEIYIAWAGPDGIVFDRSLDQGETWLNEDIFVCDFPGGWAYSIPGINRCNGLPVTICDLSTGPNNGTIYINWTDQRNGEDDTDVWICKSTDGGETWNEAVRVNDDPPGKQQFFTWMTVDQTNGYLYFVFYDRRNYDDENTDVYMAVSRDGGETFINFKISESPFLPYNTIFFGDYTNVTAHNDIVRPIWARLNDGELSVWTAIVDPTYVDIQENKPELFSLEQNYPNPFKESTYFKFKVKNPAVVSLQIHDVFGRVVATLINKSFRKRGKYVECFNPSDFNLNAGVYYFSLFGNENSIKHKMIFLK